jgi:hypothetical protein
VRTRERWSRVALDRLCSNQMRTIGAEGQRSDQGMPGASGRKGGWGVLEGEEVEDGAG